jgi:hypothetical protein
MADPANINEAIEEVAKATVKSATVDGQSVTTHSLRDLIAADEHQARKKALRKLRFGMIFRRTRPPGGLG